MTISKDKPSSPASAERAQSKRESSLEKKFHEWAAEWKRETGHLSVAAQIAKHPAYRRIIFPSIEELVMNLTLGSSAALAALPNLCTAEVLHYMKEMDIYAINEMCNRQ